MAYAMTLEEARAHAGGSLKAVPKYVAEEVADSLPHYLWVLDLWEDRRRRYVHCEWCETSKEEKKKGRRWPHRFAQGEEIQCPYCGGLVVVKHMGRGWSRLRDRLEVVWYQKSAVDPNTVVAFGAYCDRDFGYADERAPWLLDAEIDVRSAAVIVPGAGGYRFKVDWELAGGYRNAWVPATKAWRAVKRPGPLTFGDTNGGIFYNMVRPRRILMTDTLERAIAGTPLERAWDDQYMLTDRGLDGTEALSMIAKYPCIEYMTKLGMTDILPARLLHDLPAGIIHWRGKSMTKVLKLSKQRLGELKQAGITPTVSMLSLLQWMEHEGLHLTVTAAWNIAVLADRYTTSYNVAGSVRRALEFHQPSRRQKALKYMARQAEKLGDTRLNLGDFIDYWRQCGPMGEDINDRAVAFPNDIRQAEARFLERRRRDEEAKQAALNEGADKAIQRQWKKLERLYGFSFGGLTLRPARDAKEVCAEGKALHHCVAGYVQRYARGDTVICVLRRDVDPDRPWRTVEISANGRVVQDRGYHNDVDGFGTPVKGAFRAALDMFWEAWAHRNDDRGRASA